MKTFFSIFLTLLFASDTVAFRVIPEKGVQAPACKLPFNKGIGNNPQVRFYYDQAVNRCVEFVYFGKHGNGNRFFSKKACIAACKITQISTTTTTQAPSTFVPYTTPAEPKETTSSNSHEAACNQPLPPARNWPANSKTAYAFDSNATQCFYVYYDDETLNANNFPTREACVSFCVNPAPSSPTDIPSEEICSLPPPPTKEWPSNSTVGFWYDQKNGRCEPIYYDEETKNANNFNTVEECLKACHPEANPATVEPPQPVEPVTDDTPQPPQPDEPTTIEPPQPEEPTTPEPQKQPVNPIPPTQNPTDAERDRICSLPSPPNRDWSNHENTGYHFDKETEECDLVYYDEATKNENLFESLDACLDFCLPPQEATRDPPTPEGNTVEPSPPSEETTAPPPEVTTKPKPRKLNRQEVLKLQECSIQPFNGLCKAKMTSYYFNITTMKCESYIYGGCGATLNHYRKKDACQKSCIYRKSEHSLMNPEILPPPQPSPQGNDKYCTIPKYDARCGAKDHKGFVFEPETNKCIFKVLHRCLRPVSLHKKREDCVSRCVLKKQPLIAFPKDH